MRRHYDESMNAVCTRSHAVSVFLRLCVLAAVGMLLAACGSLPHGGVPTCGITDTSRGTAFCETAAELALHEKPVHIASIPDAMFIFNDQSFTIAPGDLRTSVFPEVNVRSRVQVVVETYPSLPPHASVGKGTLAELHSRDGVPAVGKLVWVFPIYMVSLPQQPSASAGSIVGSNQYAWALADARTGILLGIYTA